VDLVLSHVTKGSVRDCGCKYDFDLVKQEEIIGKRFGSLLVLAIGPLGTSASRKDSGHTSKRKLKFKTMICRCDCSVEKPISFKSLIVGTSRSCGCARLKGQAGVPVGKRRCSQCKDIKDESIFRTLVTKDGQKSISTMCPPCTITYQVWSGIKHKYGMTKAEVLAMGESQKWCCLVCGIQLHEKGVYIGKGHFDTTPHIDHEHVENPTKEHVRGILCARCNLGIGFFDDSIEKMEAGIRHLKAHAAKKASALLQQS
jgi:hypothetical protein